MQDLNSRADIQELVKSFYTKVVEDELLGYIFNDVAQVNWDHHLPRMYDFWESILFGTQNFEGNPMDKHIQLSKQTPLTPAHFERWLNLFFETVDENFEGAKATEAKNRARSIAGIMQYKVDQV